MSVLEQEHVEYDDTPPRIGHLSDDPTKRVALCGAHILGIPVGRPYVRCVVCVDLAGVARATD